MTDKIKAFFLFSLVIGSLAAIALYNILAAVWDEVLAVVTIAIWTLGIALALAAVVVVVALVLRVYDWLADMFHRTRHERRMADEEYRRVIIENRHRDVTTVIADPGQQVYIGRPADSALTFDPAHLLPSGFNGRLLQPSDFEVEQWRRFLASHTTTPAGTVKALAAGETVEVIEPILPVLVQAQRVLLAGASNSGKSNLVKHIILERSRYSNIVIIDPHSPSELLGCDVIGAGRDYAQIESALHSLVLLMSERYDDVKNHRAKYFEHDHISVFVDEFTSIKREVENAGEILTTLLTESRKVNISLCVLVHALTKDVIDLGPQIRASSLQVELQGGQHHNDQRRAYVLPSNGSHRREDKTEYSLPGVFNDAQIPHDAVVLSLPDPMALEAQMMHTQGFSDTAIAKAVYNVKKPSGRQIKAVRKLRQTHDTVTA